MKLFGRKKARETAVHFDPETQYAVIRSSICTGEKVAGFKNKTDGHFTDARFYGFGFITVSIIIIVRAFS